MNKLLVISGGAFGAIAPHIYSNATTISHIISSGSIYESVPPIIISLIIFAVLGALTVTFYGEKNPLKAMLLGLGLAGFLLGPFFGTIKSDDENPDGTIQNASDSGQQESENNGFATVLIKNSSGLAPFRVEFFDENDISLKVSNIQTKEYMTAIPLPQAASRIVVSKDGFASFSARFQEKLSGEIRLAVNASVQFRDRLLAAMGAGDSPLGRLAVAQSQDVADQKQKVVLDPALKSIVTRDQLSDASKRVQAGWNSTLSDEKYDPFAVSMDGPIESPYEIVIIECDEGSYYRLKTQEECNFIFEKKEKLESLLSQITNLTQQVETLRLVSGNPEETNNPVHFNDLQQIEGSKLRTDRVLFGFDDFGLDENGRNVISDWARWLTNNRSRSLLIIGYADADGTEEYNHRLSKHRAEAVASQLVSEGVQRNRVSVKYFGEQLPVADNTSAATKRFNRRVEFIPI